MRQTPTEGLPTKCLTSIHQSVKAFERLKVCQRSGTRRDQITKCDVGYWNRNEICGKTGEFRVRSVVAARKHRAPLNFLISSLYYSSRKLTLGQLVKGCTGPLSHLCNSPPTSLNSLWNKKLKNEKDKFWCSLNWYLLASDPVQIK